MISLVMGDSHVFWLERFRQEPQLVIPNLCLRAEDHLGKLGIRGRTVPSLKSAMAVKSIKRNRNNKCNQRLKSII